MISTTYESIELFGDSTFQTSCGRQISLSESLLKANLEIEVHSRDKSDDLPNDVLKASLLVADSDGDVWKATSLITCASIFGLMGNAISSGYELVSSANIASDIKDCFKGKVIGDSRFSSDDRFFRTVVIDGRVVSFQFHYTTVTFDLAIYEGLGIMDPRIAIFVKPNSLFDSDSAPLPGFYYLLHWERLFQFNTAVYSDDYKAWRDDPIPRPLVFEATQTHFTPNKGITTN